MREIHLSDETIKSLQQFGFLLGRLVKKASEAAEKSAPHLERLTKMLAEASVTSAPHIERLIMKLSNVKIDPKAIEFLLRVGQEQKRQEELSKSLTVDGRDKKTYPFYN